MVVVVLELNAVAGQMSLQRGINSDGWCIGDSQHQSLLDGRDSMVQGHTQLNWVNTATWTPENTLAGQGSAWEVLC